MRIPLPAWAPGLLVAGLTALAAWGVHTLIPAVPLLTAAVVLGILLGNVPPLAGRASGTWQPGLTLASKRLMRIGIVLLGLKLSVGQIAELGWGVIASTVAVVLLSFGATYLIARALRLPDREPLLLAAGFAICGASAIGAMSGAVRADRREAATPVAMVTLCGTLAIAVLPLLWGPLGLDAVQFGHWVGAGVHDVGQVVATAQIAGAAALSIALVVKLTRVLMLAPMVALASAGTRRAEARAGAVSTLQAPADSSDTDRTTPDALAPAEAPTRPALPPVIPLFVAGFIAAVLLRSLLPLPAELLAAAEVVQTALLACALVGLGAAVKLRALFSAGGARSLAAALASWLVIAALAYGAVLLAA